MDEYIDVNFSNIGPDQYSVDTKQDTQLKPEAAFFSALHFDLEKSKGRSLNEKKNLKSFNIASELKFVVFQLLLSRDPNFPKNYSFRHGLPCMKLSVANFEKNEVSKNYIVEFSFIVQLANFVLKNLSDNVVIILPYMNHEC